MPAVKIERVNRDASNSSVTHTADVARASTRRRWALDAAILLGLIALTVACYRRVGTFDFVDFDDPTYIVRNEQVRDGLSVEGLRWALTNGDAGNWHPITWLSHMADCTWFGVKPGPHHVVNLVFHVLNTVLLYTVLRRLTSPRVEGGNAQATGLPTGWTFTPGISVLSSAIAAALFAVHPLRVESVAWVSERKDVLSGLFWLLTMHAYVSYARRGHWWRYGLVMICLAMGLLAKPMVVTLPLVLLLLDYWPLGRLAPAEAPWRVDTRLVAWRAVEKLPLLLLAIVSSVLTVVMQSGKSAVASLDQWPLHCRVGNAVISYVTYLQQALWPTRLAYFYPIDQIAWKTAQQWLTVAAASAVLIVISVVALWQARRWPALVVGWCWYLGTLVPVIGLVQVGEQAHADRYTYLPLIGPTFAVAWCLSAALARRRIARGLFALAAGAAIFACALQTEQQAHTWSNDRALCAHAIQVTQRNHRAEVGLGRVLENEGQIEAAIDHYRRALLYNPAHTLALHRLGLALGQQERWQEAAESLERAVALRPSATVSRVALARVLTKQGRWSEAAAHYQVVAQNPAEAAPFVDEIAAANAQLERFVAQANSLVERMRSEPENEALRPSLAQILISLGRYDDALRELRIAQSLGAQQLKVLLAFATAHRRQGELTAAADDLLRALELAPASDAARDELRDLLRQASQTPWHGDEDGAINDWLRACRASPLAQRNDAGVERFWGELLAAQGEWAGALAHLRRARELAPNDTATAASLAATLATAADESLRDLDEAYEVVTQASVQTDECHPRVERARATVLAARGESGEAVRVARRAALLAELAADGELRELIEDDLERYQGRAVRSL